MLLCKKSISNFGECLITTRMCVGTVCARGERVKESTPDYGAFQQVYAVNGGARAMRAVFTWVVAVLWTLGGVSMLSRQCMQ